MTAKRVMTSEFSITCFRRDFASYVKTIRCKQFLKIKGVPFLSRKACGGYWYRYKKEFQRIKANRRPFGS